MGLTGVTRMLENRQALLLAIVFLAALALRLVLLLSVNNYYWYGGMSSGFHVAGRNLAEGRGFAAGEQQQAWVDAYQEENQVVVPVEDVPVFADDIYHPVVWRVPGYGFLSALSYRAFGAGLPLRVFQAILDSTVPILLFFIVKQIFPLRAAMLSAFIYALWPPFARNSIHALGEAFLPFLMAVLLLLLIHGIRTERWRYFLLAGLAAGTLVYFRSEWLLLSLVLAAAVVMASRRLWLHAAVIVLVSTSLVVPWLIRNHYHTGSVVIQANTGTTLWEGLGEYPNPWGAVPTDAELGKELQALGLSDPVEVNRFYLKRFFRAVASDPLFYAGEVARRLPRVVLVKTDWGFAEVHFKNPGFQQLRGQGENIGVLGFFLLNPGVFIIKAGPWLMDSILFALALGGLIMSVRRGPVVWLLAAPTVFVIIFNAMTHFEPRYLVPAIFPYCIFASVFIMAALAFAGNTLKRYFPGQAAGQPGLARSKRNP